MKHIMTIDLEYDWESEGTDNITVTLPKLLDLFDDYHVTATFFVMGEIAEKFPEQIKSISKRHEIASHSFSHKFMNRLSDEELEEEITNAKSALEKLGIAAGGFRCPYFVFPKNRQLFYELLKKYNFTYDSSLSTFFPGRYFNLTSQTSPHKVHGLIELPMPNFIPKFMPAGLSYYRIAYPFSKFFNYRLPYMIYLHPCEFLNKPIGVQINPIVRQFYKRNQGSKAWHIFREFINDTSTDWISCREYVDKYLQNLKNTP